MVTKKKKAPKEEYPDLYKHYRMLTDSLMEECNELHRRIAYVKGYMDSKSFLGFVWAGTIRKLLMPDYLQHESDLFKYFREAKEYIKEVCF